MCQVLLTTFTSGLPQPVMSLRLIGPALPSNKLTDQASNWYFIRETFRSFAGVLTMYWCPVYYWGDVSPAFDEGCTPDLAAVLALDIQETCQLLREWRYQAGVAADEQMVGECLEFNRVNAWWRSVTLEEMATELLTKVSGW